MRPVKFTFDDTPVFEGFTNDTHWNGFLNVWVKPEVRDQIASYFEAESPDNPDEQEACADMRKLPTENGLVCFGWGYTTQEADAATAVAHDFAKVLRKWLTVDELRLVIERNKTRRGPDVCHSHDFCDANVAMLEAMKANGFSEDEALSDDGLLICNAAWTLAKDNEFWCSNERAEA